MLLFAENPVKEAEVAVWNVECAWDVYCAVEGELNSLYEVEGDCVFEAAANTLASLSAVRIVKWPT